MKGIDKYITGANIHEEADTKHTCPKCGKVVMIAMYYELGGWFYMNDADIQCLDCFVDMIAEGDKI